MAALDPVLVVTDVAAGPREVGVLTDLGPIASILNPQPIPQPATPPPDPGTPASTTLRAVSRFSVTWRIAQPEDIAYEANGTALDALTPGQAPGACRIIGPSLDGGSHQEARLLSTGAQVAYSYPPAVSESGKGLGIVLGTGHIGRFLAQQITVADAFNGQYGAIKTTSGAMVAPGNILPGGPGIAGARIGLPGSQQAALLAFTYKIAPLVARITLDIDSNRDSPLRATAAICDRLGSAVDPQLAQFVLDSGDFGLAGGSRTVAIGYQGTAAHLTFDGVTGTPATVAPILRGSQAQAQTQDMCASVSFEGGPSGHGMPDGARITATRTLNHTLFDATGDYRSGLLVAGLYINRDQGGVAYWPGDGAFHWMSQQMGVTDLWYDEDANPPILYAATDLGVYAHSADPADTALWARLGGMALKVLKLCKDAGTLYALVEFQSTGQRHILSYPAPGGTPTGYGYDGWAEVASPPGISDFSVCSGVLYAIAEGTPTQVVRHVLGSTADDTYLPANPSPTAPVITGLDVLTDIDNGGTVTGTAVRTSDGSAGLFVIQGAGTTLLSIGGGLVDSVGAPVMVNAVTQHGSSLLRYDSGDAVCFLWAATNRGVYVSDQPFGGNWRATSGQNNLGDANVLRVASGPGRTWLGRMRTPVYASTDQALFVSLDGAVTFIDALNRPLDAGPAFFALWKKRYGVYPNNTAANLNYPDPTKGPYRLVRSLPASTNWPEYTLYNMASQAPGGAHRNAQIAQISAPALVSEVRASVLLLDEMARFLAYTASPQTIIEIESKFSDTADPLRTLRPGHKVLVNGAIQSYIGTTLVTYATYSNLACYVLEHTIALDAGRDPYTATTKTRLGTLFLEDRSNPDRLVGDMSYALNRQALY